MAAPNGLNLFLLIISVLQMLLLQVGFMRGKVKWEAMWVIFVECVAYGAALVSPGADFVSIHLTNGMWIEWMRYAGWILTCPVLLMTLVSMTTEDGTKAPTVRLVPLLVSNLTMVLLGITAAANLPPVKWYIFAMALCFGGVVFSSAIQCFIALYEFSPCASVRKTSLALCLTFLAGWGCFPCAFVSGHSGMNVISIEVQWGLFVIGDILSKNCWVGLAVLRSHQLDGYKAEKELSDAHSIADEDQNMPSPSSERMKRRGSNSNIIMSELNQTFQKATAPATGTTRAGGQVNGLNGRARPAPITANGHGHAMSAPLQHQQCYQQQQHVSREMVPSWDPARGVWVLGGAPPPPGAGLPPAYSGSTRRPGSLQDDLDTPGSSRPAEAVAPTNGNGEQADINVLRGVLARYNSMPLVEREALVPVFAALLASNEEPPPSSLASSPGTQLATYPVTTSADGTSVNNSPRSVRGRSSFELEARVVDNVL